MEDDARTALASSHLGRLPDEVLDRLFSGAVRVSIPRGSVTHRERDPAPHLELMVAGVIRVYVTAPDGRTMTIRYCRPGHLLGVMSLFSSAFSMPATTQALVDTEVLRLSPTVARDMARDARVAAAFLIELSERGHGFVREIAGGAFTTVRERVARHLLDLASGTVRTSPGGTNDHRLIVSATQQEVADAVGTVREVVVKVLRELRDEGVVQTRRDGIILLDPERLIAEEWNPGS